MLMLMVMAMATSWRGRISTTSPPPNPPPVTVAVTVIAIARSVSVWISTADASPLVNTTTTTYTTATSTTQSCPRHAISNSLHNRGTRELAVETGGGRDEGEQRLVLGAGLGLAWHGTADMHPVGGVTVTGYRLDEGCNNDSS